jgi:hypothetical protein
MKKLFNPLLNLLLLLCLNQEPLFKNPFEVAIFCNVIPTFIFY